ncbi:cytochrome P450 [Syncephalis fuscata]|nr:cytochrome P450 [Syncephalis fuscata]
MGKILNDFAELLGIGYDGKLGVLPTVLLGVLFAVVLHYYMTRPHPNEPPRASHTIPFVGNGIEFIRDTSGFFYNCRDKYGETFSFLMFGRWITIIGRSEIRNVMRAPDEQFSFNDAVEENRFHIPILRRQLSKQLDQLCPRMAEKIAISFNEGVGDPVKPYRMEDVSAFIDGLIAKTMATCLIENKELQENPEVLRMMSTVTRDAARTSLMKRVLPTTISRLLTRLITDMDKNIKVADEIIAPEIIKRRQEMDKLGDDYVAPNDMLSWIADVLDDNGNMYNPIIVARRSMQIAFASVTTTSTFTLHFLNDVAGYSEYRKKLQEEQDEIIRLYGDNITPDALKQMPFLDACVRESLRLNSGAGGSLRLAMDNVQLKNGYYIPNGKSSLFFHGQEVHAAKDLYGTDPTAFNPYHHYKAGDVAATSTKPTTGNDSFIVFGLGHHTCPGRFLAVMAIKMVAAHALRRYDFSTLSGTRPGNSLRDGVSYLPIPEPLYLTLVKSHVNSEPIYIHIIQIITQL